MEPRKIKYICEKCNYEKIDQYPESHVKDIPSLKICPECNRLSFRIHNPTYIERMTELKCK